MENTSTLNFFISQSQKSAFDSQYAKTNTILGVLLGYWAWNIFDAVYFYKKSDFFTIDIDYRIQKADDRNLESYGSLQMDFRF